LRLSEANGLSSLAPQQALGLAAAAGLLVSSKANQQQQEPQQHDEQRKELSLHFMICHSKNAIDSRRNM
jgi:hypothetical protein